MYKSASLFKKKRSRRGNKFRLIVYVEEHPKDFKYDCYKESLSVQKTLEHKISHVVHVMRSAKVERKENKKKLKILLIGSATPITKAILFLFILLLLFCKIKVNFCRIILSILVDSEEHTKFQQALEDHLLVQFFDEPRRTSKPFIYV